MNEEIRQISEELAKAYEEITFLYEISRLLSTSLDIEEICRLAMEKAKEMIPAESGSIRLLSEYYKLKNYYGWGPLKDLGDIYLDQGIIGQVFGSGKPMLLNDVSHTPYNEIKLLDYHSFLGVPLVTATHEVIGVIILANFSAGKDFFSTDKSLLIALATQTTVAVESARHHHQAIEQNRMEEDLRVARRIQNNLLPAHVPDNYPLEIAVSYETAREVGGDYFDFFALNYGYKTGSTNSDLGFAIGDVMGKGIAAALVMAMARSVLKASMMTNISPGAILRSINRSLYEDIDKASIYLTLWYGIFNFVEKKLIFASAGAPPLMHFSRQSNKIEVILPESPMIGVNAEASFKELSLTIMPGDLLLFFTDGVNEARSPEGELFGLERLKKIIHDNPGLPAEELKTLIYQQVKEFTGESLSDDMVLVVMKVKR